MEPHRTATSGLVDQLRLEYQPLVCLSFGLTHGACTVALAEDGPRGLLAPSSGALTATVPVQSTMLAQVLGRVAATMAKAGPLASVGVDLHVRPVPGALTETVERIFAQHAVSAAAFRFTLAADEAMRDIRATAATAAALRDLGCQVGADGVGATFASVHLLHALPLDFAEIHPRVVANVLTDPHGLTEVSTILRMAADADITSIAAGVESFEQAQWLRDLGCRLARGPFFGPPCDWLVLPTPHHCDAA